MKQVLAERLLAHVMGWGDEEVKREIGPLLLLAEVKYDEYHQFGPGMRFIERLARWLGQLDPSDRPAAYRVVREHLIFISSMEMHSLIGMAYPEFVLPLQRQIAAQRAAIDPHRIRKVESSDAFKSCVAKTLYIGLSDGSQIGMLRRMNPRAVDHESTLLTYLLPKEKATEVLGKLRPTLEVLGVPEADARFELVVLVDDFTASGTSFVKRDGEKFTGKLAKALRDMKPEGKLGELVNLDTLTIQVLFYVSTEYALSRIRATLADFCAAEDIKVDIRVNAVHAIDETLIGVGATNADLDSLLKARFQLFGQEVMDSHYMEGDCTNPHRGFNGGDLPLVLFHNAPNNGLPILWHESDLNIALFPRTARHGAK